MLLEKRMDARAQVRPFLAVRRAGDASDQGSPTSKRVIRREDHDGAHDGYEHAPNIEAGDTHRPDHVEDETAYYGADDPEDDIEDEPLAGLVDDLARDKPGDEPQKNPADDRHVDLPYVRHLDGGLER